MKIRILVIAPLQERAKLMRSLNKALRRKYRLLFVPWPSTENLRAVAQECQVIFVGDFAAAPAAAKSANADTSKPIIFISSKAKYQENLKKYSGFVTLGHNWKLCLLDHELLDTVESAINLSHHSHKMRTTLHAVRKQLDNSTSVPEHIPYYRQVLQLEENVREKNKELLKMNEELKELDTLKSEFLSMASHELNAPVIPMKLQAQNLLSEIPGKLNAKQKKSMEMILRNVDQLNVLLSDVLDSAKLEADRLKMFPEKTNVSKMISQVVEDVTPLAAQNNISVETNTTKLPVVEVDQKRLKQVLLNLISNSIKFTTKEGKITITAAKNTKDITITITDTGTGIPKEMLKTIFNRFVQATPSYKLKKKGTGLGLSICKGIVTRWGGEIWAESEGENEGASFQFTIPIKKRRSRNDGM